MYENKTEYAYVAGICRSTYHAPIDQIVDPEAFAQSLIGKTLPGGLIDKGGFFDHLSECDHKATWRIVRTQIEERTIRIGGKNERYSQIIAYCEKEK